MLDAASAGAATIRTVAIASAANPTRFVFAVTISKPPELRSLAAFRRCSWVQDEAREKGGNGCNGNHKSVIGSIADNPKEARPRGYERVIGRRLSEVSG